MLSELKKIFQENLNIDLQIDERLRQAKINDILHQGEIFTADEFYLLSTRVDEIYNQPNSSAELQQINILLSRFESK